MLKATLEIANKQYVVDFHRPINISFPLNEGTKNPNCYWADEVKFETIEEGNFIGDVSRGGTCNYKKLIFAPHGNGTHTECYGHLSADKNATINQCLTNFFFTAELITITPEKHTNNDFVISLEQVKNKIKAKNQCLIIRTLPNELEAKQNARYSGTNPPYLAPEIGKWLNDNNFQHLVIDLPSVDREQDEGNLLCHKGFFGIPDAIRKNATITELAFIPETVPDGEYLLQFSIINLSMDASPSMVLLYEIN
jgi:arylformamidase